MDYRSDSPESSAQEGRSPTVCHLCRQRKTKCTRELPNCSFCVKAKVRCQYVTKVKKRGLRAGYVSELESRIESLEQQITEFKNERSQITSARTPVSAQNASWTVQDISTSIDAGDLFNFSETPAVPGNVATTAPDTTRPFEPRATNSPTFETAVTSTSLAHSAPKSTVPTNTDAAVTDLMTLQHAYLQTLVDLWFKENHSWYPILSRQHLQDALAALPTPLTHIDDVVLKAVVAITIAYSSQAICLGYHGRSRLSQYLRSQVISEAFSKASLKSLQALLIISIMDYGNDNVPSTFSLLSVCRRMCENIGLFRQLLSHMQTQSPSKVGPPAIQSNPGNELAIPLTWATLGLDAVSTLGISWRDVSAAIMDHLSSVAYVSTPDLRDSYKSHVHLGAIGLQPLHSFLHEHEQGQYDGDQSRALSTCDEIYQNLMSYVRSQSSTSYTLLADGYLDFDPNLVHTTILANAGVILLYARLIEAECSKDNDTPLQRSLQACEDIAMSLRSLSDSDLELNTPMVATMCFIAARFKLLMYRKTKLKREPIFDSLMHGISMSGRRWGIARRLDIVLRAAIVEVDTGHDSTLPADFWVFRKSHLDIFEDLKEWVAQRKQTLYIGALNGPYV